MIMDGISNQLLARATLSNDQNRAIVRCDMTNEFKDLDHLLASTDDVLEVKLLLESGPQVSVLQDQRLFFEGPFNDPGNRPGVDRFLNEIKGPQFHRLHRFLDRSLGRDNNHFRFRLHPFDGLQHLNPIHLGHNEVRDHQVHGLLPEKLKGLLPTACQEGRIALFLQKKTKAFSHSGIILDDENQFFVHKNNIAGVME